MKRHIGLGWWVRHTVIFGSLLLNALNYHEHIVGWFMGQGWIKREALALMWDGVKYRWF